jgi:hypothetical protein
VLTGTNDPVSAAGDVNRDGIGDFIVGASGADPGGRSSAGASYVVFGRDAAKGESFPAAFPLLSLLPGGGGDGTAGFVLTGIDPWDHSGTSVSNAGDISGDGLDDLIVGAYGADLGRYRYVGEAYVVSGRSAPAP